MRCLPRVSAMDPVTMQLQRDGALGLSRTMVESLNIEGSNFWKAVHCVKNSSRSPLLRPEPAQIRPTGEGSRE